MKRGDEGSIPPREGEEEIRSWGRADEFSEM